MSDLEDRKEKSSSRFRSCLSQAANWRPKLKEGMEALHSYRESLASLQRWMTESDLLIQGSIQSDLPESIQAHEVN